MTKQKLVPKLNAIFYKSEMGSESVKEWLLDLT